MRAGSSISSPYLRTLARTGAATMATAVYDDKRTYYYGAGGTSWVLPAESFAAFEANQDAAISAQTFEEDEAKEDAAAEEVAADDAANEQWVVRLHPDSGQIFYHSHVDNTSSWNNPYEEGTLHHNRECRPHHNNIPPLPSCSSHSPLILTQTTSTR